MARQASLSDARTMFEWRNDPVTRSNSRSSEPVAWAEHERWLVDALNSEKCYLLVIDRDGTSVGTVRWDHLDGDDWEVSITVAPSVRGRGWAIAILRAGERALPAAGARLIATIHADNEASRRLFERAGYVRLSPPDDAGFARWSRRTAAAAVAQ
jgi:RimJ/RimL family protein N-acetyltransferase